MQNTTRNSQVSIKEINIYIYIKGHERGSKDNVKEFFHDSQKKKKVCLSKHCATSEMQKYNITKHLNDFYYQFI